MTLPIELRRLGRHVIPLRFRYLVHERLASTPLVRGIVYGNGAELAVIDREMRSLKGQAWRGFSSDGSTRGMSERVVEVPWILSRYKGERCVLDIGHAYALPSYLHYLLRLRIPELHGIDLTSRPVPGMIETIADLRKMPFPDSFFDCVICISTLEHVGCDNSRYRLELPVDYKGDEKALTEMRRIISRSGRILITVPFGRVGFYGWYRQYNLSAWNDLVTAAGLRNEEIAVFEHSAAVGWRHLSVVPEAPMNTYRENGVRASGAVLCACLTRP